MSDDILRKAVLQQGIIYWSANWKTSLYGMFAACESLVLKQLWQCRQSSSGGTTFYETTIASE